MEPNAAQSLTQERWHQIKSIFEAAVQLRPPSQDAFLDQACSGDEELRLTVKSLLSSDEQEWELLEKPALEAAAGLFAVGRTALSVGQHVGHYRILDLLGVGGMGEVYLAEDVRLGRKIALKLLPADFTSDQLRMRRFQQEARTASALNHPNILTIYDIGQFDEQYFIASEFIDGETLRSYLHRQRIGISEAIDITVQLASALSVAHAVGIIHRDIKPDNVMLRRDGYVKLLDFGLAKLIELGSNQDAHIETADSTPGLLMGTVKYMSPEQARGSNLDSRSDIFSLGVILYEMVAGRAPFEGRTSSDLIASILQVDPPPLGQYSAEAPAELQAIVSKALRKDRGERYESTQDLLVDLNALRQDLGLRSEPGRTVPNSSGREATSAECQREDRPSQLNLWERLPTKGPASLLTKNRTTAMLLILIAIILFAATAWLFQSILFPPAGAQLSFQERDWVLITNFQNRTGDPLFDGTLEAALERELSNSTFVNVIPRERVEDALRLMKQPLDTNVDLAIGKEVCLRDGGIRALLAGRMEKLGSSYLLSVSIVDPHSGRTVVSTSEDVKGEEQVGRGLRQLSNWVRKTLGERLASIRQSDLELEKVTTPSLRALQLYTQADAFGKHGDWKVAEQLLRQAIVEDSGFASAHNLLAWCLRNQYKSDAEWNPPSDRALELSERVSERERYFIQASYYSMRRQDETAIPIYEALLERYPDHYWGNNNLAVTYNHLLRNRDAAQYLARRASLRPNDFRVQTEAAIVAARCHQTDQALLYAKRANELISPEEISRAPYLAPWLKFFLIYETYFRGDFETTLKSLDDLAATIDSRSGQERDAYAMNASAGYLGFGRLKTADEIARKRSPGLDRDVDLALIALNRNDQPGLRHYMRDYLRLSESDNMPINRGQLPLLIRAGLLKEATNLLSSLALKDEGILKVCEGQIALARSHTTEAIHLLEQGVTATKSELSWWFYYPGVESLATAHERQSDLAGSLRVLEEACREDEPRFGWFWKIELQLAQLYRTLNRIEDARRIEAKLFNQLRYADEDHPILVQLRRMQTK